MDSGCEFIKRSYGLNNCKFNRQRVKGSGLMSYLVVGVTMFNRATESSDSISQRLRVKIKMDADRYLIVRDYDKILKNANNELL